MSSAPPAAPAALPFFLDAQPGRRFCLFHAPAGACRGSVLYVHPFGEEMNKARRMAALQARSLALLGYGVLQIDLYGCGDSSGDFGDARWDIWRNDVALAAAWLWQRQQQPLTLWGLRLGALLALAVAHDLARAPAREPAPPPHRLLLWQPLLSGAQWLTQFLRLGMLAHGEPQQPAPAGADSAPVQSGGGAPSLRAQLQAGATLEIAGYRLAPALAAAITALEAVDMAAPDCPVHWLEVSAIASPQLPPPALKLAQRWRDHGVTVTVDMVAGAPFWASQEINENQAVLDAGWRAMVQVNA